MTFWRKTMWNEPELTQDVYIYVDGCVMEALYVGGGKFLKKFVLGRVESEYWIPRAVPDPPTEQV